MHLFAKTFVDELPLLKRENVRVVFLGDIPALPKKTRDVFEYGLAGCRNHTGMVLALAVNYGARAELARAARLVAQDVAAARFPSTNIDETVLSNKLYTAGLPDPELVIRTSGEMRVSNYLLWQIAYSEFYITDTYWPDFDRWDMLRAIASFQGRDRRFGGLSESSVARSIQGVCTVDQDTKKRQAGEGRPATNVGDPSVFDAGSSAGQTSAARQFLVRSGFGIAYAVIFIACLLLGPIPTALLVSIMSWLCCYEVYRMMRLDGRSMSSSALSPRSSSP